LCLAFYEKDCLKYGNGAKLLLAFCENYDAGSIELVTKKSLLRLLLPAFAFAVCAFIGILLSTTTEETWAAAIGVGMGLIVFSVIGVWIETKKPKFLYYVSFGF